MESVGNIKENKDFGFTPSENVPLNYLGKGIDAFHQVDKDPSSSRTQFSIESTIIVPNDLSLYNSNNSELIDNFSAKSSKHHRNSKSSANNSFIQCNKVNSSVSFDLEDFEKFNFNTNNLIKTKDTKDLKKDPMERRLTINSINSENMQESIRKLNLSSKNKKVNLFATNNTNLVSYPNTGKCFKLGGRKFSTTKKLGKGSYGSVYLIKDEENNQFALKKYYENQTDLVNSQMLLIKSLNHECLPQIYKSFKIENVDYIIQDYYPISLNDIILNVLHNPNLSNKSKTAEEKEKSELFISIAYQLICCVSFLHEKMIIHRDLKPSNIMIDYDGTVKLIDFDSMIKIENQYQTLSSNVASIFYLPPEIFLGEHCYGFGLDIWSLGCVLAEMYLGYPIFQADSSLNVLTKIRNTFGGNHSEYLNNINLIKSYLKESSEEVAFDKLFLNCSGPFVTILRNFFQLDSKLRNSVNTALSSDYFRNMNLEMSKLTIKQSLCNLVFP